MPDLQIQPPPEIYDLLERYQLGKLLASYPLTSRRSIRYRFSLFYITISIWLILFAVLSTILIFQNSALMNSPHSEIVFYWPIGWIFALILVIRNNFKLTLYKEVLYVCKAGLLLWSEGDRNGDRLIIRWDFVEAVWLNLMYITAKLNPDSEEIKKWINWTYRFRRTDGETFTLRGSSGIFALRHIVEREMNARLLPKAIETYEAGQPVVFGNVQVSKQGIQLGNEKFAWQHIFSMEFEDPLFKIRLPDWEHTLSLPKDEIPNVFVLQALIRHVEKTISNAQV